MLFVVVDGGLVLPFVDDRGCVGLIVLVTCCRCFRCRCCRSVNTNTIVVGRPEVGETVCGHVRVPKEELAGWDISRRLGRCACIAALREEPLVAVPDGVWH